MGDDQAITHTIGITGATGAIGGRVAARLARIGAAQRLIVRDINRAPELPDASAAMAAMAAYEDPHAFERAVKGAATLFLVSATESADRLRQHISAIDAAVAAGVTRIVYLSFLSAAPAATFTFARDHFYTETHIRSAGVAHTFLRPSFYLDMLPHWIDRTGVLRGPAGNGRVAWVSRDDVADVAAAVLTRDSVHDGRTYDVTGPEAVTLGTTVERLSALTAKAVRYVPETWEEALESRRPSGAPEWAIEGWASSYAAIANGEMDVVVPTVPDLAGHPAQSIEGYLRRHPSTLAHVHN
ncbi:SDR family oxidoreductase [Allosalinactinospora lopnorensis]|uniref:SDR family oxidoreductase n=1 Tax=Allosalinactinospora lopnorensis TaxID=1352348 RepID=UPI000623DEAB|nr:SDR family oxidoreductase [Allosalinactinospora lopnorensis]